MENNKINMEIKETKENSALGCNKYGIPKPTMKISSPKKNSIRQKTNLVSIQEIPNEEDINIIITQTNYTREKAIEKLLEWENNYMNVIKEYLNPNFQNKTNEKKITNNQKIFSEIRNFMDGIKYKSTLQ